MPLNSSQAANELRSRTSDAGYANWLAIGYTIELISKLQLIRESKIKLAEQFVDSSKDEDINVVRLAIKDSKTINKIIKLIQGNEQIQ